MIDPSPSSSHFSYPLTSLLSFSNLFYNFDSNKMDWSSLPFDLIHLISKKLSDISDFIRFRAVCTTWCFAAPISDPPPQLPWLLDHKDSEECNLRFYSLSSSKVHTIHSPLSFGRRVEGPSHEYLLTFLQGNSDYRLLNPLNNKVISLPYIDLKRPRPILIGPDPIRSGTYVVALFGNSVDDPRRISHLAVFRNGETKWTTIAGVSGWGCYSNGLCFSINMLPENIHVYDVLSQSQTSHYEIGRPFGVTTYPPYLIVSSGEIIRVSYHDDELLPVDQCKFDIHKLEFGVGNNDKPAWVRIKSIGDEMLFLDKTNGFSISASCFAGYRGNCIYFLKERENGDDLWCNHYYILCRYDINVGRAEELACPFVKCGTWFVPGLGWTGSKNV